MKRPHAILILSGLFPLLVVPLAYLVNLLAGGPLASDSGCQSLLDGCVSISRAVRSGPGLHIFRAVMLPCAVLTFFSWALLREWLHCLDACSEKRASVIFWLGATGALFLVLYATWLGTQGEWYSWLRRYGVTVYFGGTALAQLLMAAVLWPQRAALVGGRLRRGITVFTGLVAVQWLLGVLSVIKRIVVDDPFLVDRIENTIEWVFGFCMAGAFLVLAWLLRRARFSVSYRLGR